jgi:putative transposase
MQLSKTQFSALLTKIVSQEDGFNEILRMSFEAMIKAERQEHLIHASDDKGNGFRQEKAYGQGKMLELQFLRTREGNFYPLLMSVLRDQEEESRKIAFELYGAGPAGAKCSFLIQTLLVRACDPKRYVSKA